MLAPPPQGGPIIAALLFWCSHVALKTAQFVPLCFFFPREVLIYSRQQKKSLFVLNPFRLWEISEGEKKTSQTKTLLTNYSAANAVRGVEEGGIPMC